MTTSATVPNSLEALLASSLTLWDVRGRVVVQNQQAAVIHADSGAEIRVARLVAGQRPMRWRVEGANGQARTCLSIVGAIGAVREMLGVTAGTGLRLSPVRS